MLKHLFCQSSVSKAASKVIPKNMITISAEEISMRLFSPILQPNNILAITMIGTGTLPATEAYAREKKNQYLH